MVDIRDFILSRGNFGTLRTPQQYINAFNIKKNIDAMFGQGTSDKIADTIDRVDDAKDKAKQTFTQGVNQAKNKAKSVLDKALKNPVVQKVAPVVNTVVGATGAANAADRASRYSLTTTPKEKIIDNTQRVLYGVGGVTGALGMTPIATAANAAAMGLNAIPKNYIPQGSGVNNPADYANLYTPEQLAGRGLDPVSVARYLEIRDNANKQPQQVAKPVQVAPVSPQNVRSKSPQKSALDEINDYIDSRNNATPALPPLPSATGPAYLGQDSVGNLIRERAGSYQAPTPVDPRTTYIPQNIETPVWKTNSLTPTQAAGASGLDNNGNPYLSALNNQITPINYSTGNTIPNLGFAANPYSEQITNNYNRLLSEDWDAIRREDLEKQWKARIGAAILGLDEPLPYNSTLASINAQNQLLQNAAQFQDAITLNNQYGMPLSAGFASPDTLVNNIYGPMFKAPLKAQEDYRNAMYEMDVDRANAINNILRDTNKSELDKARDLEKANRAYAQEAELQRQKLEAARALEEYKQNQQNARANLSAQTQAKLLDKKLNERQPGGSAAKPPTLSSLVNSLANISMTPGMEDIANIVRNQILLYYGPQALENATNAIQESNGNPSTINYFGD